MTTTRRSLVVAVAAAAAVGACGADPDVDGTWRFVSLEHDGEVLLEREPFFLEVDDDGFRADTTCNTVGGELGGEIWMTAVGCSEQAHRYEDLMADAFRSSPTRTEDRLAFDSAGVRLVYEAYEEPMPAELFTVLGDPAADVGESALPPASATGSVPPDFDSLVPVPTPVDEIDLFLAEFEGNVCVVYGTPDAMDKWCRAPRLAERWAVVVGIPIYGAPRFRIALIPDEFANAAAEREALGAYESNVLFVRDDAPPGEHVLTSEVGSQLELTIPGT